MAKIKLTPQQTIDFEKLVEMETPDWVTKEIYDTLLSEWDTYKFDKITFRNYVMDIFLVAPHDMQDNPKWKFVSFRTKPSILFERYKKGLIVSSPATGQDPKTVTPSNIESASRHAGRQWGDNEGSEWLAYGAFNLIFYPNGEMVLEPVDIEHRIVGLFGFLMGIIPIKSDEVLYFDSSLLIDGKIVVNDLTLSEIVEKANLNLKNPNGQKITQDAIINRFDRGLFNVTILPMYSEDMCHKYYREYNSNDVKSLAQLLHAKSEDSNIRIKKFSSLKNERFKASDDALHPFYSLLFNNDDKVKLETFMISHLIYQFILNGNELIPSSDGKISDKYVSLHGYEDSYCDDMENKLINNLNFLYELFKYKIDKVKNVSRQQIMQLLKLSDYLESEGLFISDKEVFIDKFLEFLGEHIERIEDDGSKTKLELGYSMRGSSLDDHKKGHTYIKKHFLSGGNDTLKYSDVIISTLGIVKVAKVLPRIFDQYIITDSAKKHKNLDIDGKELTEKPVGGHIISDFELMKLTDEQRDEIALQEFGTKFIHKKNCRAMSSYHNLRMSVLRLSEYVEIINEKDEVIKAAIKKKRESYLND